MQVVNVRCGAPKASFHEIDWHNFRALSAMIGDCQGDVIAVLLMTSW